MTPARRKATPSIHVPLWRSDAGKRLRMLLPELIVSILVMTCFSTIVILTNRTNVTRCLLIACISQVFAQTFLYVCTYLSNPERKLAFATPLVFTFIIPSLMLVATISREYDTLLEQLVLGASTSMLMGMLVFYFTRTRPIFVFLAVEMLIFGMMIDETTYIPLSLHIVGFTAFMVLYVMRNAATRITIDDGPATWESDEDASKSARFSLGIYGQIAAIGAVIGVLCLAAALGGNFVISRAAHSSNYVTSQPTHVSDERPQATPSTPTSTPPAEHPIDGHENSSAQATPAPLNRDVLVALLLIAILMSPFAVWFLLHAYTRGSLQRQPDTATRVARIYLAILKRLDAVGITREETMTPIEFLEAYELELTKLTEPAGLDTDAWIVLTDAYEEARYAGLEPTEDELKACWQIYDALPKCIRMEYGWRRYLTGPFWHM